MRNSMEYMWYELNW